MRHPAGLTAPIAAVVTALLLSTGCTISVAPVSPPAGTPTERETTSAAQPPSSVQTPAGGVNVATLVSSATRPAVRTTATIKGDSTGTSYDDALSLWAGCDGRVEQVIFSVTGHEVFQGSLGLRTAVPDDIIIEVLISVDNQPVSNTRLDGTDPTPALVPVRFLVDGGSTVTTHTKVVRGTCGSSAESYAVLVGGYAS